MNIEEKWKIHHRVECISNNQFNSRQIEYSLGAKKKTLNKLASKYAGIIGDIESFASMVGYATIIMKVAVRAPSMSDEEAIFIKNILDDHLYVTKTYTITVKL